MEAFVKDIQQLFECRSDHEFGFVRQSVECVDIRECRLVRPPGSDGSEFTEV